MRETILVVEDEDDILDVIQYNLQREGFDVLAARTGIDGLRRMRTDDPDLVLLDLMLPGLDGLDVCQRIKEDPLTRSTPIVIVSARGEESDVVLGLGLGADDYITKPFSPRELMARVRAVLRRGPLKVERGAGDRVVRDGVIIDAARHALEVDGEDISITATEMRLLHYLASHPGRVFTRDQLLSRVVGDRAVVIDRNIDVHVGAVRRKLGRHRALIQTVRGVGYRFQSVDEQ
jgi:two-component system phosphate regulon response regulator PhoB